MNITIVTCFFNLADREPGNTKRRTQQVYLDKAKFIYDFPFNVLFYCDPEFEHIIYKERESRHLETKTKIHPIRFEDLDLYQRKKEFIRGRKKTPLKTQHLANHGKHSINYSILVCSKQLLFGKAALENYFNTTHFIWIDFGIDHLALRKRTIELFSLIKPLAFYCF